MQVIDLFSGVGGFGLGACKAGFSLAGSVDIDPSVTASHHLNLPNVPLLHADLGRVRASTLVHRLGLERQAIDGIVGGPPCQGFSHMGRRDPGDSRNLLVARFFYYVRSIRPTFFLFENVPGILEDSPRSILDEELERVSGHYIISGPTVLDAADFGVPTHRRRVFVLGFALRSGISEFSWLGVPRQAMVTVEEAITDLPDPDAAETDEAGWAWGRYAKSPDEIAEYARTLRATPPPGLGCTKAIKELSRGRVSGVQPTAHTVPVVKRFMALKQGTRDRCSRFPRLSWSRPSPTLRAGTGRERGSFQAARPIHPADPRVITVREAARLQGFPDWFQFHPTKWHSFRMIGNSVSPIVAACLLTSIKTHLRGGVHVC